MHTNNERGIALVLALLLTSAMSVLAVSLMFLSRTETFASMNYRMMSQARYAGEASIQKAGAFLMDGTQYTIPASGGADPLSNYDRSSTPVRYNGQPVILSATSTQASNYPVAAVQAAFNAAASGSLTAGHDQLTYGAYATLMSMKQFDSYGGGQSVVQTWKITGIGGLANRPNATLQVEAVIETPVVSANSYAAFATANTCGALYFHGDVTLDSYDSGTIPTGQTAPTLDAFGGNVGTNGNLQIQGSVDVKGNLSTPRTGVGSCHDGAVTALTETGSANVEGSIVHLPTDVSYPTPTFSPMPPTSSVTVTSTSLSTAANAAATCTSLGLVYGAPIANPPGSYTPTAPGNCTASGSVLIVDGNGTTVTMPNVNISSGVTLRLVGSASPAQVVAVNSLTGSGSIEIEANMAATNANESIVLKVAGKNPTGVVSTLPDPTDMEVPFNLDAMGWKQNSTAASNKYDASALQIVYGGTGTIDMDGGNSQSAATVYAPNANFILKGTQDLYGSVLAKTINNEGNASIHYDRRLRRDFKVAGHPMASLFGWQRY